MAKQEDRVKQMSEDKQKGKKRVKAQLAETNDAKQIRKRLLITVGLIVCGFCLLVVKLSFLSIAKHDEYLTIASNQQLRDTVIPANRGTIYDTNMNVLAQSAPASTVALIPKNIEQEDYDTIAAGMSEILGVDYQTVYDKCGESSSYSIVKRQVDQPVVDELKAYLKENGITSGVQYDDDFKRYYPYGAFAAQVLGFVGTDNQGLSGLELYYDDYLSGTPGRKLSAATATGGDMYYENAVVYEPQAGYSLVLTIDEYIQFYLEKHLEAAYVEHRVENGACAIAMDVNTGAILGMATKGDFDPNDPFTIYDPDVRDEVMSLQGTDQYAIALQRAQQNQWRNKAVSDLYEPGSVFKVITASAALETGACTLDSSFYCGGSVEVGDWTIHCANLNGHGQQNFLQAIINSCNPAFISIATQTGAQDFYRYFEAFGLTQLTGIDLPGEAQSIYISQSELGRVQLASASFGQSNSITPIQMITAVSAVANGGYLVQPHLVRQIIDEDGTVIETIDPQTKRQVISSDTSELMTYVMEEVVEKANGQNAYVAGFRIGGKSGTSEKLSSDNKVYWASFCAIAPADDPQVAVLIILDEANSSRSIYGGVLVAPIAGAFMADVLPYIGVDAVYSDSELSLVDILVPNAEGMTLSAAYAELNKTGLTYQVIGSGDTIVTQYPLASQAAPPGSVVILYTEESDARMVTVPDLSGYSIEEARLLLKSLGLNLKVSGAYSTRAQAAGQSAEAGVQVPAGTVITVEFYNQVND